MCIYQYSEFLIMITYTSLLSLLRHYWLYSLTMCPSVLELPTLWMTAPSLAFNLGLPLTLKGLACKMSKHFHHSFAVPTGTRDLFCAHRNTKGICIKMEKRGEKGESRQILDETCNSLTFLQRNG